MIDYKKILNPEQLAAVTADDGPLLVLAAAGTGKTHTLVYRVAYLIEKGIRPEEILLLTFTNRASREMIERAQKVAGEAVGNIWSGTFHHVCNRFLRRFGGRLGFELDFKILDRDDSRSLIDETVKNLKLKHSDFPKKDVLASLFSNAASRGIPIEVVIEEHGDVLSLNTQDGIAKACHAYETRKRDLMAMDFDDLLTNGLKLLKEHADVRKTYQEKFRHVLVDEYQDTNGPQAQLVDILGEKHLNVMAVGDDFQCIYSWRGADFRNIMDFPKRYPDCKIVKLERNYRSTPEILTVANACIAGNPDQYQKTMRATRKSLPKPQAFFLRDGEEQSQSIARRINALINNGYDLKDMAVLYRAHFHSIELQIALARYGIPFVISSGIGVFEQVHVKDVLAFLRVCSSANDELAFVRVMCLLPGVGAKTAAKWWQQLGNCFDTASDAQRKVLMEQMKPAVRSQWEPINKILAAYHNENLAKKGGEIISRFFDAFYSSYLMSTFENGSKRADDINELAVQIMQHSDVPSFLQEVALLTNLDHTYDRQARKDSANALHLSTVHQAKGMEWPIVFVIWVTEGMFPSSRTLGESGDDAEERRLFYVATTRAKDSLFYFAPEIRRSRDGGIFYCKPSRFIKELPRDAVAQNYGMR